MPTQHLYYRFKPYLPWRLRMAVRRMIARRQRRVHQDTWPINETAGRAPRNWPGWPGGKKFALVITHDVESSRGLEKCRPLMELDRKLGFHSSFNFIPEGEYRVSRQVREELAGNGFEVGVHDLRHDGKLYWKRSQFPENARSINHYLHEWNASGFRSAFMLHQRECLHELDLEYDASTFDTDPFEPQPVGRNTIFPFWVPRGDGDGYVELPYTLPQDSTLFLVLQEGSPAIWKQKLAWIAERGGMALVNVHPDYTGFQSNGLAVAEYPVAFYEEFLRHVATHYQDAYWNALPREVARWYKRECRPQETATEPEPSLRMNRHGSLQGMSAAVVLYSNYESDPRPRREAEALRRAGMEVDVICLRHHGCPVVQECINGVKVFHAPLKRRRAGKLLYAGQYAWFLLCAFCFLSLRGLTKKYRLVHVHNMPDFLVFSALLSRVRGAKIILDLHDPVPELFRSIYGLPEQHRFVRWLKATEKYSIAFADLILTPNLAFKDLFTARSCPPEKIAIVMNSPDARIFDPGRHPAARETPQADQPFILMYHGLLVERHGLDLAIQAIAALRSRIPQIKLNLYGEPTGYLHEILALVRQLDLQAAVQYRGYKNLEDIAADIAKIDLGIIPNRLSVFTQINFPTRIFEYLAMNKPVLTPSTRGIRDYFNADTLLCFEPGNVADLAEKIAWAYLHPEELRRLVTHGRRVYEQHRWETEEQRFVGMVDNLVHSHPPVTVPRYI